MRMVDLQPGDILKNPSAPANFPKWGVLIGHIDPSPLYPHLVMFISRLSDDTYSFDSLSPIMRLIDPVANVPTLSDEQRQNNLRWALGMYAAEKPQP
jgi:hypothetical protein